MKQASLLSCILAVALVSCAGTQAVVVKDGAVLYNGPGPQSGTLGFVLPKSARVEVVERRVIPGAPGERAYCSVKIGPTEGWLQEEDIAALTGKEPAPEAVFISEGNNTAFIYLALDPGGSFMFHFQSLLDFTAPMTFQGTWSASGDSYRLDFPRNDKRIVPTNGFSGFFGAKDAAYSMPENFTLVLKKDAASIMVWNVVCRKV